MQSKGFYNFNRKTLLKEIVLLIWQDHYYIRGFQVS